MERFHRGAARLEDIRIEAAAARLGHAALNDLFRAGAPHPHLDAYFFSKASARTPYPPVLAEV